MHMNSLMIAVLVIAVLVAIRVVLVILKFLRLLAIAAIGVGVFATVRIAVDAWPHLEPGLSPTVLLAAATFALVAAGQIGWLIGRRSANTRSGAAASASLGRAS